MTTLPRLVAFDTETTGLNPWKDKLLGVALAWRDSVDAPIRTAWYPWGGRQCPWPRDILASEDVVKVAHNARFDIKFLATCAQTHVGGTTNDTLLLASILTPRKQPGERLSLNLKQLARKVLGSTSVSAHATLLRHLKELRLTMKDLGHRDVDPEVVQNYCCEDARNTLLLYEKYNRALMDDPARAQYYYDEMLPLERVLLDMEMRGNHVDARLLGEAALQLDTRITRVTRELEATVQEEILRARAAMQPPTQQLDFLPAQLPEFSWNSPSHCRMLYYGIMGLGQYCFARTPTGEPSLNRKDLKAAVIPPGKLKDAIGLSMKRAAMAKNMAAYVTGIMDRMDCGIIHAEYLQSGNESMGDADLAGGTATGRLSHRNPNLGNLPRSQKWDENERSTDEYWMSTFVKELFVPAPGHVFIHADFSQIELRVAAHLAQDKPFLDAFNAGEDPHQSTATAIGITRQQAKTVNFLLIYFGSPWRLCFELGADPGRDAVALKRAENIHKKFFDAHPELFRWIQDVRGAATRDGYVTSMFGRRRYVPEVWSHDPKIVAGALRQAGNHVVQSAAASICKRAMLKIHDAGFKIVNQVHDSIDVMVPEGTAPDAMRHIKNLMENAVKLDVPLPVDAKIIKTFRE